MKNSLSNIFNILLLLARYHQNCQVVLATTGINGLDFKAVIHISFCLQILFL